MIPEENDTMQKALGRLTEKEGFRWLSSRLSLRRISGNAAATSLSSASISPDALLSSSMADSHFRF
ncbi:MAG: hypothetical protein EOO77_18810 [Oxalobacteraceae bacterium]|nr:MAG: hypothetical protein EOO77_18810 [Oxalobacteraceae bacterium]